MKFRTPRFVSEITQGHHRWRWKRKLYKTSEVSCGRPVLENVWRVASGPIVKLTPGMKTRSKKPFQDRGEPGAAIPNLQKLRKLAAICTYGASRTTSFLLGDPPKRVVKRLVRSMPGHAVRCDYLAYYDMDHSNLSSGAPSCRRSNEHLRLGETVRLAHGRLKPRGAGGRRAASYGFGINWLPSGKSFSSPPLNPEVTMVLAVEDGRFTLAPDSLIDRRNGFATSIGVGHRTARCVLARSHISISKR
jgi:hypothetical protein